MSGESFRLCVLPLISMASFAMGVFTLFAITGMQARPAPACARGCACACVSVCLYMCLCLCLCLCVCACASPRAPIRRFL